MSFELDLTKILEDFADKESETLFQDISKAGKRAKREVVARSTKRTGDYSKGWAIRTVKTPKSIAVTIYNKTDYRLTHLLEKGHIIRNKYGTFGRAPAHPHIKQAQDEATNYLMTELMKDL